MRRKDKPSKLEKFLGARKGIEPITAKRLESDLAKLIEGIRDVAGRDKHVNGALRYLMLQPLRQVAEDLVNIQRMGEREAGRLKIKYGNLGTTGRWLVTPNCRGEGRRLTERLRGWYPKRKNAKPETLYELDEPWAGCDYLIWNHHADAFRAWPRTIYEPQRRELYIPGDDLLAELDAIEVPEREHSTPLLRLSLAIGERRVKEGWIGIDEPGDHPWVSSDEFSLGVLVPQSYAAACIHHLGPTFGVDVEEDGDDLIVTWNGAFVVRERIRPSDWIAKRR